MTTVFVMVDGMRPDAIAAAGCRTLPALLDRSAYTLSASSVMPSVTLPCHMSIFHSVPPTRHGVITNDWMPMARPIPGLMDEASRAGKRCGFFYNWEPLRNLSRPGALHMAYFRATSLDRDGDHHIVEQATAYLADASPDFLFVYLGTVDEFGHRFGWMEDGYLAQLAHVDGAIDQLLNALPADSSVLLQADHGGHDRGHGTDAPDDMLIPWLVSGPGIRTGHEIRSPISLLDTAPTLARLLGIAPHRDWEGRCPEEIFSGT